ncbi:hypothetical protein FGO68_gene15849 [Halteria grandinella]|uniref:Uncharacterized protein n=1 Tax=Halteria grandinella TaxID=5974 RepID=A0A8J8NWY2_HALGN|nr:hypothetical protein FGO68_gene15849 [Halteria grandinella]
MNMTHDTSHKKDSITLEMMDYNDALVTDFLQSNISQISMSMYSNREAAAPVFRQAKNTTNAQYSHPFYQGADSSQQYQGDGYY